MRGPGICRAIASGRVSLSTEKETQADINALLVAAFGEAAVSREHRLSDADIPDFMVEGVVVEVKIRGAVKRAVFKQLERYAAHEDVKEIVLATNLSMGLPSSINDKPVFYVSLGKGWM